jgi:ribosome biogenesis GTPase A
MNKARRELAARLKKSDLVIELLDARAPQASSNPMLSRLRGSLPCLKLMTKIDLADPATTLLWQTRFEASPSTLAQGVEASDPRLSARLSKLAQRLVPKRGSTAFPVRAVIVGIPNVGKSTLFNTLLGAHKADVRDKPAVTRREQHAHVSDTLLIIDTPGVLWPKMTDQRAAYCLAALGSVGEGAFEAVEVARFALAVLRARYTATLSARFRLEIPSGPTTDDALELLAEIGRRRGCLVKGGSVDLSKAAALVLGELRSGKLGRVSLEVPGDEVSAQSDEEAAGDEAATRSDDEATDDEGEKALAKATEPEGGAVS